MFIVSRTAILSGAIALATLALAGDVHAENLLYSFKGGSDGSLPAGGLIIDASSNLYGTTGLGGGGTGCNNGTAGCGTIFKLATDGQETELHAFQGGNDGAFPLGALVADSGGNLYGTTEGGGSASAGTVFKLASDGSESVLYAFAGTSDGAFPTSGLIADSAGNLYGTAEQGGNTDDCSNQGCGVVFELAAGGSESVLYAFQGVSDGVEPIGSIVRDSGANIYGATFAGGGSSNCQGGCGTVFKVASDGTETVLHSFQAGTDGWYPGAGVIADGSGNLYGTTTFGGDTGCAGGSDGCGTVYKVTPDGTESILYAFKGGRDGDVPMAGLVLDKAGNLYGTTYFGGGTACRRTAHSGCGTVFKLTPNGSEKVLVSFRLKYGQFPKASLLLNKGILYGTAAEGGGHKDGVVFKVQK